MCVYVHSSQTIYKNCWFVACDNHHCPRSSLRLESTPTLKRAGTGDTHSEMTFTGTASTTGSTACTSTPTGSRSRRSSPGRRTGRSEPRTVDIVSVCSYDISSREVRGTHAAAAAVARLRGRLGLGLRGGAAAARGAAAGTDVDGGRAAGEVALGGDDLVVVGAELETGGLPRAEVCVLSVSVLSSGKAKGGDVRLPMVTVPPERLLVRTDQYW